MKRPRRAGLRRSGIWTDHRANPRPDAPEPRASDPPAERARASRAQLEAQLAAARQRGDREAVSKLLARMMMVPRDTPPGSKP